MGRHRHPSRQLGLLRRLYPHDAWMMPMNKMSGIYPSTLHLWPFLQWIWRTMTNAAFASLSRICVQLLQSPIPKEKRIGKAFPWQQGLKELGL
jgi:hypothetical protein